MIKFLARLIFSFFSNLIALFIVDYFITGFQVGGDSLSFLIIAAILTLLNAFVRPILRLILTPIIILTFGLGIIAVNALIIYLLDILMVNITITGLVPLVYGTLVISLINMAINFSAKKVYKTQPEK